MHFMSMIGKATIARHSRRNVQCNADEELETIDQNLHFDYKFQVIIIEQSIKILTSFLAIHCSAKTSHFTEGNTLNCSKNSVQVCFHFVE